ncbi:replication initiation protein [Noviherbaspirillum pedocola]|uniref:Replication initiation protein n=1 Tax=Noviherbaspirillum pedocola TaxID=2801341 RepID=A0A934T213_9BURK|nr:replication initiation protein [Noviherbaspirillum pedocola]MBK4737777.1 replication initiation protein [Noviherbaspirillum pedocola]
MNNTKPAPTASTTPSSHQSVDDADESAIASAGEIEIRPTRKKRKGVDKPTAVQEFRKANDSIGLRVMEGKFSLLSRKIYNIFINKAQELGVPGREMPPGNPGGADYFWIRMREIVKSTEFDSNNYDLIKETAQELLDIKVVAETDKMWTSERLLSGAKIYNTKGLKSQGGEVWIGFAFPPEVMQMVLNPNTYTKFSLRFQTALRGNGSLGLYEIARRYATSPSHLTYRDTWERWYQAITGTPISEALPEYKYFKRDTLKKAIAEINSVTDIKVELIEYAKGRKVMDLQFRVDLAAQSPLDLAAPPPIDPVLIERIIRFGISKEDARDLYLSYDERTILDHIELTEERMNNKRLLPIDSPAAYFKTALKAGYAKAKHVAKPAKPNQNTAQQAATATPQKLSVRERFVLARSEQAMRLFNELPPGEQQDVYAVFADQAERSLKTHIKKQGFESGMVRSAFSEWFAEKSWGPVTDSQIIEYLDSGRVF